MNRSRPSTPSGQRSTSAQQRTSRSPSSSKRHKRSKKLPSPTHTKRFFSVHANKTITPHPTQNTHETSLFRVPRLSIAPMVDVTAVFFRLFNRMVSHNTTLYTEMIVDKQLLNSLPFARASIGLMHPNESNNYLFNMKRFFDQQQIKSYRSIDTMLSLPSNRIPNMLEDDRDNNSNITHNDTTTTAQKPKQAYPLTPSTNPLPPVTLGAGSIAQISGADAFELTATAVLLQAMGFDGININMGCPASSAQSGLHGALMMITPHVEDQIERLRSNPSVYLPVSIKCRIGVNKPANYNWFKEWICAYITQTGICHYIVHSRIAKLNFNPKKNLNIPPLHPQYIHYLQNDIRQYVDNEKKKLMDVMDEYYKDKSTITPEDDSSLDIKPFGITGVEKNACMYYIDKKTGKKCYVPLSICLEYNGGAVSTSQVAELCWALNENGGYVLRPGVGDAVENENDNDKEESDDTPSPTTTTNNNTSNFDDQTVTRLQVPAESSYSPLNTEPSANNKDDFHWMRRSSNQNNNNELIDVDNFTLKQPLLPGIMVGRGDMNDVLFPLFYDAFHHALVLASNGKIDAIPNLISPQIKNTIDDVIINNNDPYNHVPTPDEQTLSRDVVVDMDTSNRKNIQTNNNLNDQNKNQVNKLLPDENNNVQDNHQTVDQTDPDELLYTTLQQHMQTDPILHNSGLYIDVRTGEWVNSGTYNDINDTDQDQVDNNENIQDQNTSSTTKLSKLKKVKKTSPSKLISEMSEFDKIQAVSGFPSTDFNIPQSPSRMDILLAYLTEVDKILFDPFHASNLQFQYELLTSSNQLNIEEYDTSQPKSYHSTLPSHHETADVNQDNIGEHNQHNINNNPRQDKINTLNATKSTTNTPSDTNYSQQQLSFMDSSTPSITPHESLELHTKHRLTQFDQQALVTSISNPLNREGALSNQPYPYEIDKSSCSFATTVTPGEHVNNNVHTTPHPFVEGIVRLLLAQELADIMLIFDTINFIKAKVAIEQTQPGVNLTSQQVKKIGKPANLIETIGELYKAIQTYSSHPFLETARYKHYAKLQKHGYNIDNAENDPEWMSQMQDYDVLQKYRPIMNQLKQSMLTQFPTNIFVNNNDKSNMDLNIISQIISSDNFGQDVTKMVSDEALLHVDCNSSNIRSRVASNVNRLTRLSETQAITSSFYGYLYGVSDLFLRPLYSIFANTEGNEQWRKIIHTACLLSRGTTNDIFSESYFWSHENQYNGNPDPKTLQQFAGKPAALINGGGRMNLTLQYIEENDPDKKWDIRKTFPYIGNSNERNTNDRADFTKSSVHKLAKTYLNNNNIKNDNNNNDNNGMVIEGDYKIDTLAYDPSTMKLYPTVLLNEFTTESYEKSIKNDIHHEKRSTGIIDPNHPITTIPTNILDEKYTRYLKSKADNIDSKIEGYAKAYIEYNKQSFNTYINNSDDFMHGFYKFAIDRDQDTINYVTKQKIEHEKKMNTEKENESVITTTKLSSTSSSSSSKSFSISPPTPATPEESKLMSTIMIGQKGGAFLHVNLDEKYINKRYELMQSKSLRRAHLAFGQRFPFDFINIKKDTMKEFLNLMGGDINLYKDSPFAMLGRKSDSELAKGNNQVKNDNVDDYLFNPSEYRHPTDIEYSSYQQRHNLESVSWLHSICCLGETIDKNANANDNIVSNNDNKNSPDTTNTQSNSNIHNTNHVRPNMTSFLTHSNDSNDILSAMPIFTSLCDRYPILSSSHSYQYLIQQRVNNYIALSYLRNQLMLVDSVTIPQEIMENFEYYDLHELRRASYQLTLTRDLLRQPILDFQTKYKLYYDAKHIIAQMNGVELNLGQSLNTKV